MTDWYYHEPGQGKVGPLTADDMRAYYRSRRITRETLAWHEGLREWQPVARLIEELGLTGIEPDTSRPPPVPPRPAASTASHASSMRNATGEPPKNRNGCLIAAIVLGIGGLVLIGILAAIAIPAYRDYVERAKGAQALKPKTFDADRMADTDTLAREMVTSLMREFYVAKGNTCPEEFEFDKTMVRMPRYQGDEDDGWFTLTPARAQSGQCAYEVNYRGFGPAVDAGKVRFDVTLFGDDVVIICRNISMPTQYLPTRCQP